MKKLFGTDGIRGIANTELGPDLAFRIGRAGAYVLSKHFGDGQKQILVAQDSRKSGDMLQAALSAGFCSAGADVFLAGVIPTPALAHLVRHTNFSCAAMISASHNRMADNGIKLFDSQGYKLPDAVEAEIEALVAGLGTQDNLPRPIADGVGSITHFSDAQKIYASYIYNIFGEKPLAGLFVVLDCANGAASFLAPEIFARLGARVHAIHNSPNGKNINEDCGSTHLESLRSCVLEMGADIGLAFDGDGDRVLGIDERGGLIDGDIILAVLAAQMKAAGALNSLVATVMSNKALDVFCAQQGIELHRTQVGDRYVLEKMLECDLPLGGEQSGHIILRKHGTTGDGILTGLMLVSLMQGTKISDIASVMRPYPQVLVNVDVPNDKKAAAVDCKDVAAHIQKIEQQLGGGGRILVRASGTESLIRIMIEGEQQAEILEMAQSLKQTVLRGLGA